MIMHILGTGTATVRRYVNTSCVFEENGSLFLVDGTGGNDILRCFEKHHLDWRKLHHAFLSHEHTDHFLGMIWVVRMICEHLELDDYEGSFHLYGHDLVLDKLDQVCRMVLKKKSQTFLGTRIFFHPVEDLEEKNIWNHNFTFFDIGSTKARQFGFRMEYEADKSLVFAGDEPLKGKGQDLAKQADWLLMEAFCLDEEESTYHAHQYHHQTVKEAAIIGQELRVNNLLLWHTEDGSFGHRQESYTKEASAYYEGQIWIPDDGDEIFLG